MPQRERQPQQKTRPDEPKTPWRLIEGGSKRILKAIEGILESTGDDSFEVEFRIYRSSQTAKPAPTSRKTRRPGIFSTIFMRRRKKRRVRVAPAESGKRRT